MAPARLNQSIEQIDLPSGQVPPKFTTIDVRDVNSLTHHFPQSSMASHYNHNTMPKSAKGGYSTN